MIKKILGVLVFLLLIIPNGTVLAEDVETICVDGWAHEIQNWGSKVDVWEIDSEDITNQSILPNAYFTMKNDFVSMELTIEQVDSSLTAYKNNQLLNTKIKSFLDKHYNTYINSVYKSALSDSKVEKTYSFKSTYLGIVCTRNDKTNGSYDVMVCPSGEVSRRYNSNNFNAVVSMLTFDETNHVFKYTVSDKSDKIKDASNGDIIGSFGGNLALRVVSSGQDNVVPVKFNINSYNLSYLYSSNMASPSELISLTKNGTITKTLNAGERVYIEFYLKQDVTDEEYKSCAGSLLGYVQFSAPTYAEVDNPFLNNSVCRNLKSNYSNIPEAYKKAYVPDCYRKQVEYFSEIKTGKITVATIQKDINDLLEVFKDDDSSSGNSIENLLCHYNPNKKTELNVNGEKYSYQITGSENMEKVTAKKRYVYNPINSDYWAADCTETLTVLYDQPKQVIAGTGFSYVARLKVERVCTPKLLKKVESLPPCEYAVECYGGPPGNVHNGGPGAGPSEDFDSCIAECDGGNYTKKCINSCYSSVYEGKEANVDKTFSFLDEVKAQSLNLVNNSSNNTVTRLAAASLGAGNKTPRGNTIVGNPITSNREDGASHDCSRSHQSCTVSVGNQTITFPFANQCNNGVSCYTVKLSDKCGGSNETDKNKSKADYDALITELKKYGASEKSQMSIIDSYLLNSSETDLLKTTWSNSNLLTPAPSIGEPKETNTGKSIDYASDDSISEKKVTVTKSYEIEIPNAYLTMINADTGEKTVRYAKSNTSANANERDGGKNYYTDINSGVYNNFVGKDEWKEGDTRDKVATINSKKLGHNINVVFSQIGTDLGDEYTWDKVNIDCFYGVYNQIKIECEEPICPDPDNPPPYIPDCPEGDVCTFGLQYMFRQVNLTDLFPDRNPRWNWNYTTKIGTSYVSNASEIIDKIENTGNKVYEHEPEYEFVITRKNIRAIRDYNDGKTYQMYDDMTCDTALNSGIKVCKSGFLDEYVSELTRNTTLGQNTDKNG